MCFRIANVVTALEGDALCEVMPNEWSLPSSWLISASRLASVFEERSGVLRSSRSASRRAFSALRAAQSIHARMLFHLGRHHIAVLPGHRSIASTLPRIVGPLKLEKYLPPNLLGRRRRYKGSVQWAHYSRYLGDEQKPHNLHRGNMDLQQQRMECLKMAFELGGKTDPIVSAAQQLFEFVAGKQTQPTTEAPAEPATAPTTSAEEPVANTAPEPAVEVPSADVIAACGTVLVLPEGGDLADAVPAQPEQQATQSPPEEPEATEATPPMEVASEPKAEVSEQQATDAVQEEAPAAQSEPAQPSEELAASHADEQQTAEVVPQTPAEAEPPASPETEAKPAEEAMLASAPANSSETV